jgi:hypothetical protein
MHHGGVDYLAAQFAAMRDAIEWDDDDRLIQIVDHVRAEMGMDAAWAVVTDLLRLARNPITDPAHAACIETALDRYRARYG